LRSDNVHPGSVNQFCEAKEAIIKKEEKTGPETSAVQRGPKKGEQKTGSTNCRVFLENGGGRDHPARPSVEY